MKVPKYIKFIVLGALATLLMLGFIIKDKPPVTSIDYTEDMFITHVNDTPINFALSFYGINESFSDGKSNPIVVSFFRDFANWVTNSKTTAWCSAYVNSIFSSTGYEYSGSMSARSWLNVGQNVKHPKTGDVVVFWRESKNSWKGHVGIFISFTPDGRSINVLGGNQKDMVTIDKYPVSQLLGYRRLKRIRSNVTDTQFAPLLKIRLTDVQYN